jgi:hypothetical protein
LPSVKDTWIVGMREIVPPLAPRPQSIVVVDGDDNAKQRVAGRGGAGLWDINPRACDASRGWRLVHRTGHPKAKITKKSFPLRAPGVNATSHAIRLFQV